MRISVAQSLKGEGGEVNTTGKGGEKKSIFSTSRGTDQFLHFVVIQSVSTNCYNSILSGKSVSV